MCRTFLFRRFTSFKDDTNAAVSLEFVIIMPFLFWAFMASYVFFDGFRQSSLNLKAAFTISDLISRETATINDDYIDSMHEILTLMTRARSQTALRVSVIRWDEEDDLYYVDWSEVRNGGIPLDDDTVDTIAHRLPVMPDDDRIILVETSNVFVPLYKVGLNNQTLTNFVYSRPRFAPRVDFQA